MREPLWQPAEATGTAANITRYMALVNERYGKKFNNYNELYYWSVNNLSDFWASVWEFTGIKH